MNCKTKAFAYLIPLAIIDALIPIPIIGLVLVYVIVDRPPWFSALVSQIYGRDAGRQ